MTMDEMDIKLHKEHVTEEKEKVRGEMLGEDLLRILGKIMCQDGGTILWVAHEVETVVLSSIKNNTPEPEVEFYNRLRGYVTTQAHKKLLVESEKDKKVKNTAEQLQTLWEYLYNRIFSTCIFSEGYFTRPHKISVPFKLPDEILGYNIIKQYGVVDGEGDVQWKKLYPKSGKIRGRTFINGYLPGFDLKIKLGKKLTHYRVVVQNPNTGSSTAQDARNGRKILYILDADRNCYVWKIAEGKYTNV